MNGDVSDKARYTDGMKILIAREPIDEETLSALAKAWYGNLIKGVVDLNRGVVALGSEWHMDANVRLIEDGSLQENLWGFNIYPDEYGDAAIEYNSLINIRPTQQNRSMEIESDTVRTNVRETVARIIPFLGL